MCEETSTYGNGANLMVHVHFLSSRSGWLAVVAGYDV